MTHVNYGDKEISIEKSIFTYQACEFLVSIEAKLKVDELENDFSS